jgi:DUF4097 and DUF4098 domain-containing protein YvlB
MKRTLALGGLLLSLCLLGSSQDNSMGRVVIPPRTSAGPRVIELSTSLGNVTVKTHTGGDIIVESEGAYRSSERTVNGMHRIDVSSHDGVEVSEHDNVVHIRPDWRAGGRNGNIIMTVPVESSLSLKSTLGNINVEGVHGEIDVTSTLGNITLTGVSGTVVASSTMGTQHISMDRVDQSKPLAFSSVNGSIDVTLPPDVKASLVFRTGVSEIWSDFDVTMTGTRSAGMHSLSGKGRSSTMDQSTSGTINGGGVQVSFHAVNGKITIHKKK